MIDGFGTAWGTASIEVTATSRGGKIVLSDLTVSPDEGDRLLLTFPRRAFSRFFDELTSVSVVPSHGVKDGTRVLTAFGTLQIVATLQVETDISITFTVQPQGTWGAAVDELVFFFFIEKLS